MHHQWVWPDIAAAAVDMMLQGAGLHLTLYCIQLDLHKQMASGKTHPIEAVVAENKTLVAVAAAENKMKECH